MASKRATKYCFGVYLQTSSIVHNTKLIFGVSKSKKILHRCCFRTLAASANSFDHIPKQFRQENLKDGSMDNYNNAPKHLHGLSPSQMDMFMTEDNPSVTEKVTEESTSSSQNYINHGGMWSLSGVDGNGRGGPSRYGMSVSMYRGGGRGNGRPGSAPPNLPSLLSDARICYLGMPIVPAVTELLVAQFMWLDFVNPSKPIYLYINSSGAQNEKMETVGSETEAYTIADTMAYCKSDVYTVNCGMAFGQAAMLLSLGTKGYRAMQPNSSRYYRSSPWSSWGSGSKFCNSGHTPSVRGFSTFDQAMQGRLASLANVKPPYPPMMEDSRKFRNRIGAPKPTDGLPQIYKNKDGIEKCELRVHLCPPPWFYNIHGVWLIGEVVGVWVIHSVPTPKALKAKKSVANQQLGQLRNVDPSTILMMDEYWKSIHGVPKNPSLWTHENAKHSYYDLLGKQMPDYFEQVVTMGSQIIALLWKLGFQPGAFYERDHFVAVLKKSQGVDVYLDLVEDQQTGIVYLDSYGFYFERTQVPAGAWTKHDHPGAWVQKNGWFYLI